MLYASLPRFCVCVIYTEICINATADVYVDSGSLDGLPNNESFISCTCSTVVKCDLSCMFIQDFQVLQGHDTIFTLAHYCYFIQN